MPRRPRGAAEADGPTECEVATTGCWNWAQRICAFLIAVPALGGSLGPILAPQVLPHVFPTTDQVNLQSELELPLLRASFELQARLYSMATGDYLIRTLNSPEPVTLDSAITGTMYSFAKFIATAERAMEHPDSDFGISTSSLFPSRMVARRQRVTGLIRQTLDAMGSRGSKRCRHSLVDSLANYTGALMATLAAAESATVEDGCPLCGAQHVLLPRAICDEGLSLEDYIVASSGELPPASREAPAKGCGAATVPARDGTDALGAEVTAGAEAELLPGEGGLLGAEAAATPAAGTGPGLDAAGWGAAAEPTAARVMADQQRTMACDRTLILHRAQRRAVSELMLMPAGPARRSGQAPVRDILPFYDFAARVYPVLEPLYRRMDLVSAAIKGRAAVHAASVRRARDEEARSRADTARLAARGQSTPLPVPLGPRVATSSPDGIRTPMSPTWAAMTGRGRGHPPAQSPRPTPPFGPAGSAPSPSPSAPRRPDGPYVPSVARAAEAAKSATCTLLRLLGNSSADASAGYTGGVAGRAGHRATLVHWLGPMASDLVRLLDPTMLCVHRERIIAVQRASLDLLRVLDAGPRVFTQEPETDDAAAPTPWQVLGAPWRVTMVLLDNGLQALGIVGRDAAFTDGSLAAAAFGPSAHAAAARGGPSASQRWRLPALRDLTEDQFSACTAIYSAIRRERNRRRRAAEACIAA